MLAAAHPGMLVEPSSMLPSVEDSRLDPVAKRAETSVVRVLMMWRLLSVFGSAARAGQYGVDAPDTSLQLGAQGVLLTPDPERSGAILAPQGQPEKYLSGVGAQACPAVLRWIQVLAIGNTGA